MHYFLNIKIPKTVIDAASRHFRTLKLNMAEYDVVNCVY